MFSPFETATTHHFARPAPPSRAGQTLISKQNFDDAEREITGWEGYTETPLVQLAGLAGALGIGSIHYKHEGPRFGLGSFKALGGSYATLRLLQRELSASLGQEVSLSSIRNGGHKEAASRFTIISATDGNHGRSVAWGAARCGAHCRIYIHAEVSENRATALSNLGAEVIRVDGDYDATVAQTKADAEDHGWLIVSDTSWPGYSAPPLDVMAGYGVMAREVVRKLAEPPTHIFLQGGVGGLAAAVAAVLRQEWGDRAPRVVIVEPDLAPCLFASAQAGAATAVQIEEETIMAGLSCGEPSQIAWPILDDEAEDFITIPEDIVAPAVRILARPPFGDQAIEAGESAVAGLCALLCAARQDGLREKLGLDSQSSVVLIGSEGVTDQAIYDQILAAS